MEDKTKSALDRLDEMYKAFQEAEQKAIIYKLTLERIREDYCGPPKMSESIGTISNRLKCVKELIDTTIASTK